MPTDHGPVSSGLLSYLTRFIGREREIAAVRTLLDGGSCGTDDTTSPSSEQGRLVTLCGVGGSGKTRLALEVARRSACAGEAGDSRFRDGVRFVGLAPLSDGAQLPQVVAAALRLREAASVQPLDALVKSLQSQRLLLVIDNCEHLATACRDLAQVLLPRCPGLAILTTSRTPLELPFEIVYAVPPLQTIEADSGRLVHDGGRTEAARLFLDRAAMVTPTDTPTSSTTETINRICQRLDGLPLAIELAASWMRVLTARDLLTEIERSIDFLSSSTPTLAERHRSMRAVLESSWQRLAPQDQRVFSALAVFSGSFSREAAEAVSGASLPSLSSLAEKSLIQRLPHSEVETRYHIHELVRQYALERLEASERAEAQKARQHHLDYFLDLVERAEEAWDSRLEVAWHDRIRTDQSNVQAALLGALDRGQTEPALRLLGGLYSFWGNTSLALYVDHLERALSLPWDPTSAAVTRARAKACNSAGYAAVAGEDFQRAKRRFDEGLMLYRQLGDDRLTAWSHRGRSYAQRLSGNALASREDVEESLTICRSIGDRWGQAWSLHDLGEVALALGEMDAAEPLLKEGLKRFEELGVSFGEYRALVLLGDVHRRRARWQEAIGCYDRALAQQRQMHFVARGADIFEGLAEIAVALHRPLWTAQLFGQADTWRETFGFPRFFFFQRDHERCSSSARRHLGVDSWSTAFEAGTALTSERAMDEAAAYAKELASIARGRDAAGLTERELEVLRAVQLGLSSQEIADRLVVSTRTVHAHLRSIFDKLEVSTRTAAAHEAARLNLV